jgi:hypothetical protein
MEGERDWKDGLACMVGDAMTKEVGKQNGKEEEEVSSSSSRISVQKRA